MTWLQLRVKFLPAKVNAGLSFCMIVCWNKHRISESEAQYCSSNCPDAWIGDGYCDGACYNYNCGWDGGDCPNGRGNVEFHASRVLIYFLLLLYRIFFFLLGDIYHKQQESLLAFLMRACLMNTWGMHNYSVLLDWASHKWCIRLHVATPLNWRSCGRIQI